MSRDMPTPRHFLIITPLLPPESGGPSYYAVGLRDALLRAGHEVEVLAFRDVRKYPSGIRHLIFLYKVFFRALHADTLIILDTVSVALPAVLAGFALGKKTIIRTGGDFVWEQYVERTKEKVLLSEFYTEPRPLSKKERFLVWIQKNVVFRLVSRVIFSTAWQRDIWAKPYGIPEKKTAIVENSFVREIHRASAGRNVSNIERFGGFLCAWRPTAFKNIDTLEKAFDSVHARFPDVPLEIFRDIPREQLHERIQKARALVIPSLSEVSPNMALDALAFGVPVVLTEDCGMKDRFGDSVFYIDPKNPEAIAETLCVLMDEKTYLRACEKVQAFSFLHTYDDIAKEFSVL